MKKKEYEKYIESRQEAEEVARSMLSDYLERSLGIDLGVNLKKKFHCLSPEHDDKTPSMSFNAANNTVHCFSCGVTWSIFDVIGAEYEITDFNKKVSKTFEVLGIIIGTDKKEIKAAKATTPKPPVHNDDTRVKSENPEPLADYTADYERWHKNLDQTDYLTRRGISREIQERFNIGFEPKWKHPSVKNDKVSTHPYVIIPVNSSCYCARRTDGNEDFKHMKVGTADIFNPSALDNPDNVVFVVESEIDGLSIAEVGGEFVALRSVNNAQNFVELVKDKLLSLEYITSEISSMEEN